MNGNSQGLLVDCRHLAFARKAQMHSSINYTSEALEAIADSELASRTSVLVPVGEDIRSNRLRGIYSGTGPLNRLAAYVLPPAVKGRYRAYMTLSSLQTPIFPKLSAQNFFCTMHDAYFFEWDRFCAKGLEKDCLSQFEFPTVNERLRFRARAALQRAALNSAEFVFTVSEFSKNRLARHCGLPKKRILVSPNGYARPIKYDSRALKKHGLEADKYFLFVGRMACRKNIPNIIRAHGIVSKLARKGVRLALLGIGKTEAAKRLEMVARSMGIVTVPDASEGEKNTLLKCCLGLISPSLYEGQGIPPLEAAAMGKPILLSDIAPFKEIFGAGGIPFVDPNSPDQIAEAMGEMMCNPDRFRCKSRGIAKALCADMARKTFSANLKKACHAIGI